jgi:hypothetical protein
VSLADAIDAMPPTVELRGDEYLGPVDAGVSESLSDRIFVAIILRSVNEPVADLESGPDLGR